MPEYLPRPKTVVKVSDTVVAITETLEKRFTVSVEQLEKWLAEREADVVNLKDAIEKAKAELAK